MCLIGWQFEGACLGRDGEESIDLTEEYAQRQGSLRVGLRSAQNSVAFVYKVLSLAGCTRKSYVQHEAQGFVDDCHVNIAIALTLCYFALSLMSQIAVDILKLVSETADVFPPLKSAAGGALYIAEKVKKFKSNKKEWVRLAEDIQNTLACVVKLLPDGNMDNHDNLKDHMKNMETTLCGIVSSITKMQNQNFFKRVLTFAQDPDKIDDMRKQFNDAVGLFQLTAVLTTRNDVVKILGHEPVQLVVERALEKFRAAIATDIARVVVKEIKLPDVVRDAFPLVKGASWDRDLACIPGTRTVLRDEIMAWIRSADPDKGAEIFMISDVAGSGKTAIAHTVCQLVHEATDMHLLCSFFFARGIEGRDDYSRVLNHIIWALARLDEAIAYEIGTIVEQNHELAESLSLQFPEIIMPLCRLYPKDKPLVIVLDALDEACKEIDDPDTGFLGILRNKIHQLPGNFRIVVTCRPEYKILHSLDEQEHIWRYGSSLAGNTARHDIQLYIERNLKSTKKLQGLLDISLDLKLFLEKAEGLFIWVATVISFLRSQVDPVKQLKRVLEKNSPGNLRAEAKMESLYQTIFAECKWDDEDFKAEYSSFMGTIINLRTPLPASAIEALHCKDKGSMHMILRPICSLLYGLDSEKDNKPVHILHLSLREFLTNTKYDSEPYFIHQEKYNRQLALCCVSTLNKELPNVTGLGFSTEDREEFKNAIVKLPHLGGVTQQLEYACQFWADHLKHVNIQSLNLTLQDALVDFIASNIVP
ncbi:hypothetical protein BV25DRAFT_1992793, partial [Artomyces pyxidatus]